jgi:hypothetical protein
MAPNRRISPLTHERLLSVLHYDPDTGRFTWLASLAHRVKVGDEAGSNHGSGYFEIGIDNVRYLAHRLAWFYMSGEWPSAQIDHRDLDRSNTRWNNLRLATHGQNVHNSGPRKHNSHGFKGVTFYPSKKTKWHARIMFQRKLYLLGFFNTPEEAHAAYAKKAAELHGEFARTA